MKTSVPRYVLSIPLESAAKAAAIIMGKDDESPARRVLIDTVGQFTAERISRLAVDQHVGSGLVMLTVATGQGAVPDGRFDVTKLGHFEGIALVQAQKELALALAGTQVDDTVVDLSLTETDVKNFAVVVDAYKSRDIGVGFAAYGDPRMPATEVVGYEFNGEHAPRVFRLEANDFQRLPTGVAVALNGQLVFANRTQLEQLIHGTPFAEIFRDQQKVMITAESKLAALKYQGDDTHLAVVNPREGIVHFYEANASLTPVAEVPLSELTMGAQAEIFALFGQLDGTVVSAVADTTHAGVGLNMTLHHADPFANSKQVGAEAK